MKGENEQPKLAFLDPNIICRSFLSEWWDGRNIILAVFNPDSSEHPKHPNQSAQTTKQNRRPSSLGQGRRTNSSTVEWNKLCGRRTARRERAAKVTAR